MIFALPAPGGGEGFGDPDIPYTKSYKNQIKPHPANHKGDCILKPIKSNL